MLLKVDFNLQLKKRFTRSIYYSLNQIHIVTTFFSHINTKSHIPTYRLIVGYVSKKWAKLENYSVNENVKCDFLVLELADLKCQDKIQISTLNLKGVKLSVGFWDAIILPCFNCILPLKILFTDDFNTLRFNQKYTNFVSGYYCWFPCNKKTAIDEIKK